VARQVMTELQASRRRVHRHLPTGKSSHDTPLLLNNVGGRTSGCSPGVDAGGGAVRGGPDLHESRTARWPVHGAAPAIDVPVSDRVEDDAGDRAGRGSAAAASWSWTRTIPVQPVSSAQTVRLAVRRISSTNHGSVSLTCRDCRSCITLLNQQSAGAGARHRLAAPPGDHRRAAPPGSTTPRPGTYLDALLLRRSC
jgi:hypothetical protein